MSSKGDTKMSFFHACFLKTVFLLLYKRLTLKRGDGEIKDADCGSSSCMGTVCATGCLYSLHKGYLYTMEGT